MNAAEAQQALRQRLPAAGFELEETTVAAVEALVARRSEFRWRWAATRLHVFVVVLYVDRLDEGEAEDLTGAAQRYAIDHKGGLPRGLQTGTVAVAVLLTDDSEGAVHSWPASNQQHRFGAARFPVLVELTSNAVSYPNRRHAKVGVYAPYLFGLVEDVIVPAVTSPPAARREG